MDEFRIIIVDDSALFRTMLRNAITDIPGCTVVATASDGESAVAKIEELKPDLVTLDVEMPNMNGIDTLRELRRRRIRSKIVMVSRLTAAGAQVTTDALLYGAFDFILKPSGKDAVANKELLRSELVERISAIRETRKAATEPAVSKSAERVAPSGKTPSCDLVVFGSSTGGPDALNRVLPQFEADFPVPIIVVQHMPPSFTTSLAARLNDASELEVSEAEERMQLRPGRVVLARGGCHLGLTGSARSGVTVQLSDAPPEHSCRPAVDFTLRSAVNIYGGRIVAVILTGMGRDGTEGCRLVRAQGGRVFAQHAEDCSVFGMPKAVITAGLADRVIKLPQIAPSVDEEVRATHKAPRTDGP